MDHSLKTGLQAMEDISLKVYFNDLEHIDKMARMLDNRSVSWITPSLTSSSFFKNKILVKSTRFARSEHGM